MLKFVNSALLLLLFVACLNSCSYHRDGNNNADTRTADQKGESLAGKALPALSSETPLPRSLVSVNSVLIAPIFFSQQSRELRSQAAPLYAELCRAASERLDVAHACGAEIFRRFDRSSGVPAVSELLDYARQARRDGLFTLSIEKYIQRDGSKYAASSPAEVSLSLQLIRSADGAVVWTATYYLKDQSLIENLFSLKDTLADKEAPHWKTASEIFVEAAREAFADLSAKRLEQFS